MTRNGKIARLPVYIRNELNERLADGEQGNHLVEWLNSLPEVQEEMAVNFKGRPITDGNLSEWKKGGYEDWIRHQENLAFAQCLADEAEELEESGNGVPLSDRIAPAAALALARLLRAAAAGPLEKPADRRMLLEILRELQNQRAGDHRAARLKMDLRRFDEEEAELEKKSERRRLWEPIKFYNMVQDRERLIDELTKGLSPERAASLREHFRVGPREPGDGEEAPSEAGKDAQGNPLTRPNPSQSESIRLNPTESE